MSYVHPSDFSRFIQFQNPDPIFRPSSKLRSVKVSAGGKSGWRAKDGRSDSDY